MKGIILHDHEVRQLAQAGQVLVVRPVKPPTPSGKIFPPRPGESEWFFRDGYYAEEYHDVGNYVKCPMGIIGTQFYVKEAYHFASYSEIWYRADKLKTDACWLSAQKLPKVYSRFTVETVSVECKRVQEITNEQVEDLSGVGFHMPKCGFYGTKKLGYNHVLNSACESVDGEPICHCGDYGWDEIFEASWDIHNPKHPWSSNPFAWFVTLKRV